MGIGDVEMNSSDSVGSFLDVPADVSVLRPWFELVRRLQKLAARGRGYSVVTVTVICNERGEPKFWLEPDAASIEPCGAKSALTRLLEKLAR